MTPLAVALGIPIPVVAFTRSPEVVVEVSRAGGLGVLGALSFTESELATHLDWIDGQLKGRPYGVDVVMPAAYAGDDRGLDKAALEAMIPKAHQGFLADLLDRFGVPALPPGEVSTEGWLAWTREKTLPQVALALSHPIALLANALGPPPAEVIEEAHRRGIRVAALAGSVKHAQAQVSAGVDIVVAQGWEAGGHTGEVSTMVLVPEVVDAVSPVPVLAAGGIGTGRQLAAALALGAQGAWTGSIWLTATESGTHPAVTEKLIAASSGDTVRSRAISGKPARQLRTAWTDAWEPDAGPGALPLPLQWLLTAEAQTRLHRFADHPGADRKSVV